ncbi:5'-nucleotidase C-terminal domain-containing protein [Nocardioides sp. CER19]|uniref:bifunctional metallophosphatase/5'-nucleotidase n=1 Tax=Nocardioides sp. CER19 TaxID=3038538 RepID=UPI002447E011|nr:5'-nucleotidase C-terminal domain-containing protein [Nocardioides sp. CER19]MDH2415865.1 5'-nucleotidase C-terminal domain-containing protein [Nocardioides sp. CER19]
MSRRTPARLAASTLGLALGAAGLSIVTTSAADAADPVVVNLVGINDFHGRINANTVKWAGTVEQVKARGTAADTLFVGAGDLVGASEFASATANDQPTIDVLNELGLDASSVGNHEFDKGWADLRDRIIAGGSNASWDYLGANVYAKGTQNPVLPEAFIKDVGGIKVGVIGAVTEETKSLVSPGGIADLDFGPIVPAINRVADELTDGNPANGEADVLVATVHAGAIKGAGSSYEEQVLQNGEFRDMALNLSPKVDAVFQGHTHQVYAWDAPVTGGDLPTRPLLQTGNYGDNVGNIQLTVDPATKHVLSYTKQNVARVTTPDADLIAKYPVLSQVKTTVDAALANAAAIGNQPVGSVTGDITTALPNPSQPPAAGGTGNRDDRGSESTLGDLVGNALRDGIPSDIGKADLGIVNPGGLRAELLYAGDTSTNPANTDGVVTYAEANNVLPFVNNIWLVDLKGSSLKKVLEQQWQPAGSSRPFLALGLSDNVQVTYDPNASAGSHITSVTINGQPLDPDATYTVSTFSFLGTGGDNFGAFTEGTPHDTGLVDRDLWISYLQSHPHLAPDFARQQVAATGLPAAVGAKQHYEFTLSKLDLTSAGSPANTTLAITADRGHGSLVKVGTATVSGGAASVSFDLPAQVKDGVLTLVAQPSGTTVTIPVASKK